MPGKWVFVNLNSRREKDRDDLAAVVLGGRALVPGKHVGSGSTGNPSGKSESEQLFN